MANKIKALCLSAVAVFAMSAMVAQSANAGVFEAESYPVTITGKQIEGLVTGVNRTTHLFETVAGNVSCTTATFHGELKGESKELTLKPTYGGCKLAGQNVSVDMNECDYLFTAENTVASNPDEVEILTHLNCPEGKSIVVTSALTKCEITVEPNQTLTGITAFNTTSATPKMDVDALIDVQNIKYEIRGGPECPNEPANGTYKDGKYTGWATLQGEKVGGGTPGEIGITVT